MSYLQLITINLHCLEEENIEKNQNLIVQEILKKDADVVFLQEVAQYADHPVLIKNVKESNYGYQLYELLKEKGYQYDYAFQPIKYSFNKYDEGLAILSKYPLKNVSSEYISKSRDYQNWRSRMYLKATIHPFQTGIDLFTTHLGWDSRVESYMDQCRNMVQAVTNENTLIGGDFNIAFDSEYFHDTVALGLIDLYGLNPDKKNDFTFENDLDVHKGSARIDYIFATKKYSVIEQEIIFKDPMVSDHYGVYMKIEVE